MSWRAITEADLLTKISGPELAALRAAALKAGQVDPVQPTIDQVTRYVRGRVAACQRNQLGAGNTVPDELIDAALALIVMRIMSRAAGISIDPKGVRKSEEEKAEALLRDVAACKMVIVAPDTVSTEKVSTPLPAITPRERRFTRCDQEGT